MRRQLVPLAEQSLQVFLRHMAMARGNIHNQLEAASLPPGCVSPSFAKRLAHQPFDSGCGPRRHHA